MDRDPEPHAGTEQSEQGLAKYFVREPAAIRGLLRRMIDKRSMFTATDEARVAHMVSAPLQVDERGLWIDTPPDQNTLQALLASPKLNFDGRLDRVTLRFSCGPATLTTQEGRPALHLPLPARLLHLQRREFVRLEPPVSAVRCLVPVQQRDGKTRKFAATIRDIGGGGLAVLVPDDEMALQLGDVLLACELELPDAGAPLQVSLRVQHLSNPVVRGKTLVQAGCQFVDLPNDAAGRLQRYIMQLDREQASIRRNRE